MNIQIANTFKKRLIGWIGRKHIHANEGLYFPRCRAIHTFFMSVPIRVVFFDKDGNILRDVPMVKPWSWLYCREARGVLECSCDSGKCFSDFRKKRSELFPR